MNTNVAVAAKPTIQSKDIEFDVDGSTITVKATNATRPRGLEHTLERCVLKINSYTINCVNNGDVVDVTVKVYYADVKRTHNVRENAAKVSALNEAMTRIIEALI